MNNFRQRRGRSRRRFGNGRNNRGRNNRRNKTKNVIDKSRYISEVNNSSSNDNTFHGKLFSDFNLHPKIQNNLFQKGFKTTTEIQSLVMPLILSNKNVLGISATGSGKTGGFMIPMAQKLLNSASESLLIVAPTRELALQIKKEAVSLIKGTKLNATLIIGGESINRQAHQLRKGSELIIGTPGRIKDMIDRKHIIPEVFNNIVIDEVDRMMDMGFVTDIKWIFERISDNKQALFFSATHNKGVTKTITDLTDDFEVVQLANNTANTSVHQSVIDYQSTEEKFDLLHKLLDKDEVRKAIIFVETKRFADNVERKLQRKKYNIAAIHGDKKQNRRKRIISNFRNSNVDYLVATNVAARGIDIDDITHVINLDEPQSYDEYIHRIGRTGRNGRTGRAYTFVKR